MALGERIFKLRIAKGLSQAQLGKALGVTRNAVSLWESNINTPTSGRLQQLAVLFDVGFDELATGRKQAQARAPGRSEAVSEQAITQIRDVLAEWQKGCTCAEAGKPETCPECTRGVLDAIAAAVGFKFYDEETIRGPHAAGWFRHDRRPRRQ